MFVKRPVRVEGDLAFIPLTQGYEAVIDAADVPLVEGFNWTAWVGSHAVYAYRKARNVSVYLHRVVAGADAEVEIDHRDGNGLNCRRQNLRPTTHAQNLRNRRASSRSEHGVKGVSPDKRRDKWRARITVDGKTHWLGYHATAEAANEAYRQASERLHGEFGRST